MCLKAFVREISVSKFSIFSALCAACFLMPVSAAAQIAELRFGITEFDERTLDVSFSAQGGNENSVAIHAEILFEEPEFLKWAFTPQPYINGTLNLEGNTSYGGGGLLWRQSFGDRFYGSIASGLVIHTGSNDFTFDDLLDPNRRIIFGSRFLFRQDGAIGVNLNEDWATEVFFEHLSNAGLGFVNEGVDNVGFRVVRKL